MKIMIIDDDQDILNLFTDFLSKRGYDVVSYLDPLVAVKEIKITLTATHLLLQTFECLVSLELS